MDSTLKFKVTDAQSHRDKELVGVGALAMASEKNQKLPVSDPLLSDETHKKASAITTKGAQAAVSYMLTAVLLVLFNKAALSSYNFPCVNVITLFQMLCSCLFLYAMKFWKIISFTTDEPQNTTKNPATLVPFRTLVHTLPLALSYLLYMLVSMESVRGISVPMYTTLRRTTVAFTMIVEYVLTGKKHSPSIVACLSCMNQKLILEAKPQFSSFGSPHGVDLALDNVGIILLGAFVAGARDLSFDAYAYAVVFIANICTAVYLASIAHIGKSSGLNTFGLMWCNGIICAPILLFWTSIRGDLQVTLNFPYLFFPGFQVVILLSCILAFLINYCVFLNTTLNSALTQTICGNLKDLLTIGLGWVLFGGLPFDFFNVLGQSLGFLGSCLYAYYKLQGK